MTQQVYDKQKAYEKGIDAIFKKDKDMLLEALDEGFYLQGFTKTKSSGFGGNGTREHYYSTEHKDFHPFIQIITSGWVEGWEILSERLNDDIHVSSDELSEFPAMWELATQYAEKDILENLTSVGYDPTFKDVYGQTTVHLGYDAVKEHPIIIIPDRKIIQLFEWCEEKGLDLYETYPGRNFMPHDVNRAGHSLWSYALMHYSWATADRFFPESWYDILKSKRWQYVLGQLKVYLTVKKSDVINKEAKQHILSIWKKLVDNFLEPYLAFSGDMFDDNQDFKYVLDMNEEQRNIVWQHYSQKRANNRSLWFDIITHVNDENMYKMIFQAQEDGFDILHELSQTDDVNESPLFLWAANIDALESPTSLDMTANHIRLLNSLDDDIKNKADELSGFTIKQMVFNTIKVWSMYDKKYKTLLETIKS